MALEGLSQWKEHPLVTAFRQMPLVSRRIFTDGNGDLCMEEVRRHAQTGERQRLSYRLAQGTEPLDIPTAEGA